jgi:LysR family glycine cleavage system transcriptional activator
MNSSNTDAEIPFKSLVAFEVAARLGSVSRAADEMALTQSAVSQRILKLEAHVGQRLFLREGHGLKLTGAGELLLGSVRETLERLRGGFERIEPYKSKSSLLLACPADFAQSWLLPRLAALQAACPGLEVWLMSEQDFSRIDRIDVDLIVSRRPLHAADIDCAALLEDRRIAVCSRALAPRLQGAYPRVLQQAPLLLLEREPQWAGLLADPLLAKLKLLRGATIHDERLLLQAVQCGLGMAYLSRVLASAALADGSLVQLAQIPDSELPRLWLSRSRLTPRSGVVNQAYDWLMQQAAG